MSCTILSHKSILTVASQQSQNDGVKDGVLAIASLGVNWAQLSSSHIRSVGELQSDYVYAENTLNPGLGELTQTSTASLPPPVSLSDRSR